MARRKPRPDSVLKNLPPAQQEELWDFLGGNSYTEGVAFCRGELGVKTSRSSLLDFWQWYSLNLRAESMDSTLKAATDIIRENSDLSSEEVEKLAQTIMMTEAFQKGNIKAYSALVQLKQTDRRLDQEDRKIRIASERLDLMERKHEDALRAKSMLEDAVKNTALTPEQFKEIAEKALKII